MKLSENARMALIGVFGAAAAFVIFRGTGAATAAADPIDAVPKGAFLVATVDMQSLRQSPVYDVLASKDGSVTPAQKPAAFHIERALGVGNLSEACGFDPISRVQQLALAVPEEGEKGDFGVAARVQVTRAELERCATEVSKAHGGQGAPSETKEENGFAVVGDGAGARLAYGAGLLLVGKGAWLDALMKTASHAAPGVRGSEHAELRRSLMARPGFGKPTMLVTAILPKSLRDRLKNEMSDEAHAREDNAVMEGILGVSSLGLAVRAGAPHQDLEAAGDLTCESPEDCETVAKLLERKRLEWSKDLILRIAGFGPLIDSFEVKRDGKTLHVSARSNTEQLAGALERALQHARRPPELKAPPHGIGPRGHPGMRPDELLRPDGGAIAPGIHFRPHDAGAGGGGPPPPPAP